MLEWVYGFRRDLMVREVMKSAYQNIYKIAHPHVRSTRNACEGVAPNRAQSEGVIMVAVIHMEKVTQ